MTPGESARPGESWGRMDAARLDRLTIPRFDQGLGMPIAPSNLGPPARETAIMAKPLLSDELWALIEPVLPRWTPSPKGGQPRLEDRKALTGILFVLKT